MVAEDACTPCRGTCNAVTGECSCPLTRAGRDCEQPLLPACQRMRPFFWIAAETGSSWQARRERPKSLGAMGALPCTCVQQMLMLTAGHRSRWTSFPPRLLCANSTLDDLLTHGGATGRWNVMRAAFSLESRSYRFDFFPPPSVEERATLLGGQLLPASRCIDGCGGAGWCMAASGGKGVACRCFPEADRTASGSCARVTDVDFRAGVVRAANGTGGVLVRLAGTASLAFNVARCLLDCSGRGVCDLQAFCHCERGYWGSDCGITVGADGRPLSWRHSRITAGGRMLRGSHAPSPRVFVHDLPVSMRTGPQLLAEFDRALTERLMRSAHREADPDVADYFWLPGPNTEPLEKLAFVRKTWPRHWNRTGGARQVLTLLGERGAGDVFPASLAASHAAAAVAHRELDPASPTRRWLALTLNGMADARDGVSYASGAADTALLAHAPASSAAAPPPARCHVCFQPGRDIVVAPPAGDIDVPGCGELAVLSKRAAATAPESRQTLLFWAGRVVPAAHTANPVYAAELNVRVAAMALASEPGFVVVNSAAPNATRVDAVAHMLGAKFCWVPPGTRYGDARRHLYAAALGCVPVFTVPDGHPTLEEVLPWARMALFVPPSELPRLPALLRAVTPRRLAEMRAALACARRALWYSSVYGQCRAHDAADARCDGEREGASGAGGGDAFDALMRTLAQRLAPGPREVRGSSR